MTEPKRQLDVEERAALAQALERYMKDEGEISTHEVGRRVGISAQAVSNVLHEKAGLMVAREIERLLGRSLRELVAERNRLAHSAQQVAERTIEYEARYYEAEEAFKDALAAGEDPKIIEAARHRLARFKDHTPTRTEAFDLVRQAKRGAEEARRALGPSEVFEEKPTIPRRGK